MAKKGEKRIYVGLVSEESGERIVTRKNKLNTPEKLELKKYSKKLRRYTLFKEVSKNLGRNEVKPKK
jgi:large subunit ribosomal protein L33